jgi:hypothetical protein
VRVLFLGGMQLVQSDDDNNNALLAKRKGDVANTASCWLAVSVGEVIRGKKFPLRTVLERLCLH